MTRVVIYVEIKPEPFEVLSGAALGNSLGLRLYSTVYPSSCFDTDTICKGSQSEKILLLLVANLTVGIVCFYSAQTETKAESMNGSQFSEDKINTKSYMYVVYGYLIPFFYHTNYGCKLR